MGRTRVQTQEEARTLNQSAWREHWEMDVLSTPEREHEIIEILSPVVDLLVNH